MEIRFYLTKRTPILGSAGAVGLLLVVFHLPGALAQETEPPLALEAIVSSLQKGLAPRRAVALVKERGVAFELTKAREERLRAAGADDQLIAEVKRASAGYIKRTKADEERKSLENERRRVDEERRKTGEARKKFEEERQKAEESARRAEEEGMAKLEEERKKLQEERAKLEEERKKAETIARKAEQEKKKAEEPKKQAAPAFEGNPAPEFALKDESGRAVRLSDFKGSKKVLVVFYFGHG